MFSNPKGNLLLKNPYNLKELSVSKHVDGKSSPEFPFILILPQEVGGSAKANRTRLPQAGFLR